VDLTLNPSRAPAIRAAGYDGGAMTPDFCRGPFTIIGGTHARPVNGWRRGRPSPLAATGTFAAGIGERGCFETSLVKHSITQT
jgi:hypothetical protein